ncbi:amidohydrolase [Hydrogenophaga sp. 2FB]|uniref:amidohydrolase n=1 Tax=Hydrogenophaga sp. 2FB TaxID=2502187 RepID=UPI001485AB2F|nr:amidohydrolase [Hydrogenophaga sp. 2FB]
MNLPHQNPRHGLSRAVLALAMVCITPTTAFALDVADAKARVDAQLDRMYPALDVLYKALHAKPELAFQETEPASRLAREMRASGFEVTEKVGRTGVVAILRNGPGPTVMVRTDMDALPMEEKTGLPYASRHKTVGADGKETFVAHSCGHDVHMAAWVGTARALASMKDRWRGTLMFIGQPAEEGSGGAKAMLADQLFARFGKPDHGFALHVGPGPAGLVSYRAGANTSTSDALEVRFNGRGAHGSRPSASIDPVVMASRFVMDVQTVISREKDAAEFGVVTIGSIQGGTVGNIIPDSVTLRGTIRSYTDAVRKKLHAGIQRTAKAVAEMAGAPAPDVTIGSGASSVINDESLTARTGEVFKAAFGAKARQLPEPSSGSEDYSEFVMAGVPSVYFWIGSTDPRVIEEARAGGKPVPSNHSPLFAPLPETSIRTAVGAMSLAVLNAMQ